MKNYVTFNKVVTIYYYMTKPESVLNILRKAKKAIHYSTIAKKLGITENCCKVQLHRLKKEGKAKTQTVIRVVKKHNTGFWMLGDVQ